MSYMHPKYTADEMRVVGMLAEHAPNQACALAWADIQFRRFKPTNEVLWDIMTHQAIANYICDQIFDCWKGGY